jgi:hypothetical protein
VTMSGLTARVPIVVRGGILATNGVELPVDPFGRVRMSNPNTMFQATSTQLVAGTRALQLDTQVQQLTGDGAVTQDADASVVVLSVGGAGGPGSVVRQSRRYVSYQPGKGRLVFISAMLDGEAGGHPAGVVSRVGVFDDRNVAERRFGDGHFFELDGGALAVVERSSVSGGQVDTRVPQASWNGDRLDGTGPSGFTVRNDRMQIFWLDMEWLGVGDVRMGVVVDGVLVRCHTFSHKNALVGSYIRTPKLPVRHELVAASAGTGPASMRQACATVISEGGFVPRGLPSSLGRDVSGTATATERAVLALSLRTTAYAPRATLVPGALTIVSSENKPIFWRVVLNYTGASAAIPGWTDVDTGNSHARYSVNAGIALPPAGSVAIAEGIVLAKSTESLTFDTEQGLEGVPYLASTYEGVPDTLYVTVRRLTTDADFHISMRWVEITV